MGKTLNARQAEAMLLKAGFVLVRTKGSHRIYMNGTRRVVVPFHGKATLHPKTTHEVYAAVEAASSKANNNK